MRYAQIERDVPSKHLLHPSQIIPRMFAAREHACTFAPCFQPSSDLPMRCLGLDNQCQRERELRDNPPTAILIWAGPCREVEA